MGFLNGTAALLVLLAVIGVTTTPRFTRAALSAAAWTYALACLVLVRDGRSFGDSVREYGFEVALVAIGVVLVLVVARSVRVRLAR